MPSPEVLDFAQLVAPVAGDNPAGADPREDRSPTSAYREFREAGRKARDAERRVAHDASDADEIRRNPADWTPVLQHGLKVLAAAKDLEVAALLSEALVRKHGFAGLRDGFRLARELVEHYWEKLYPPPDEEEGVGARVAALGQLNGLEGANGPLIAPIYRVPITCGQTAGSYSLSDYRQAQEIEAIAEPDKRRERQEQLGVPSLQTFQRSVSETPPDFFRNLLEDVDQCRDEFTALAAAIEERLAASGAGLSMAPPTSAIREALQTMRDEVFRISRAALGGDGPDDATPGTGVVAAEGAGDGNLSIGAGHVRNREEAFRMLLRVADYFKQTEPHSPVSYALEQAVRWGRMSLPELLSELLPEQPVRDQLFKLVGIGRPKQENP